MKKNLLTSICLCSAVAASAAVPMPSAGNQRQPAGLCTNPKEVKVPEITKKSTANKAAKRSASEDTNWGEWEDLGTSTVNYGEYGEFIYYGVYKDAPTSVRQDLDDAAHLQYRIDGFFFSDISNDTAPLYIETVDVEEVGYTVAVYPQALPETSMSQEYGSIMCADAAVLFDMEYYRILHEYNPSPLSMSLYLGTYLESEGPESYFTMGPVTITLDEEKLFSIPESVTIGGDMGMGLLDVEKSDEVWCIKYAIVKGDGLQVNWDSFGFDSVVDRIVNEDPNLMIMWWMSGSIMATPMEGPGRYTLGAVAYDENDNYLSSATSTVYYMPNESWNWKTLGKAKVTEDFLSEVFAMNLEYAGITPDGAPSFEVDVEECIGTPGLYRLVNLYGPTHPYSQIFDYLYDFPVYTYIDATHGDGKAYLLNTPLGFVVKGDTSGEMTISSQPNYYFDEGYDYGLVASELADGFGVVEANKITFEPWQVLFTVPVFKEYFGDDLIDGDFLTAENFVIVLPAETGVGSMEMSEAAEYFNMQGIRVANPSGVCIEHKAGRIAKRIVK